MFSAVVATKDIRACAALTVCTGQLRTQRTGGENCDTIRHTFTHISTHGHPDIHMATVKVDEFSRTLDIVGSQYETS